MNLQFTDLFCRNLHAKIFKDLPICKIEYWENKDIRTANRKDLPVWFDINGDIVWSNETLHCTTGPAFLNINGGSTYWLNGMLVSKFHIML